MLRRSALARPVLTAGLVPVFWAVLVSQAPQPPVLRSGIDVILVECSVVDRSGRPIDDLRTEEFAVTVGGTPRRIVSAQFVGPAVRERQAAPGPGRPAAAAAAGPAAVAVPEAVRQIVLVADENTIPPSVAHDVVLSVNAFLDKLAPQDKVAFLRLPWLPEYLVLTPDRASARTALGRLAGRFPDRSSLVYLTLAEAVAIQQGDTRTADAVVARECSDGLVGCRNEVWQEARNQAERATFKADQSLEALLRLVRTLHAVPGPKTVVFLSGGMVSRETSSTFAELGPAFASAQARVYVLNLNTDVLDLSKPSPTVRSLRGPPPDPFAGEGLLRLGVERLSETAGGTMMNVPGSIEGALGRVAADLSATYLIGFEPLPGDYDGQPHDTRVTATRRGTDVRGRRRYVLERRAAARVPGDVSVPVERRTGLSGTGAGVTRDDGASGGLESLLARTAVQLSAGLGERDVLVAEERSEQAARTVGPDGRAMSQRRRLGADYVLASGPGGVGLAVFRDVFEVDGKQVRPRDGRLARILSAESDARYDEAASVTAEGLKHDVGFAARNLALSLIARQVLEPAVRPGFNFRKVGEEQVAGADTWRVACSEWQQPTFIRQNGADVPVDCAFWVDPRTGQIARSRLDLQFGPVGIGILVTYVHDPSTGLALPRTISERYVTTAASFESVARLTAFRRVR